MPSYSDAVPRDALNTERRPFVGGLLLGFAHALLLALAFPPFSLGALTLFAIAPLVYASVRSRRPVRTALGVSIASVPFWAYEHQFVWAMSALGVFPLVIYLSVWPGLFVWLLAHLKRARPAWPLFFLVPLVWTGLEVARGEVVWNGYAWYLVAHPLVDTGPIAHIAALVGVYGLGAWIGLLTGWVFDLCGVRLAGAVGAVRPAPGLRWVGMIIGLSLLVSSAFMPYRVTPGFDNPLTVGVVQTNVAQDNRMDWSFDQRMADFQRFLELTVAAQMDERGRPDLIVWPETMFPGGWLNREAIEELQRINASGLLFYDELLALQRNIETPLVVGAPSAEGVRFTETENGRYRVDFDRSFNSAFVVDMGGVDEHRYDKIHLTPFGEVMPYISAWPWLEQRLLAIGGRGMTFDLSEGQSERPLDIRLEERHGRTAKSIRAATPICYEVTVPGLCRRLVFGPDGRRADVIINLTNDGWFAWWDAGRANKLLMARWRAIELGTPVIRAANTGISAVIDPTGRLLARGPNQPGHEGGAARTDGVAWAVVDLPARDTLYARIGDLLGWLCFGGLAGALILTAFTRRTPNENGAAPRLRLVGGPGSDSGGKG